MELVIIKIGYKIYAIDKVIYGLVNDENIFEQVCEEHGDLIKDTLPYD